MPARPTADPDEVGASFADLSLRPELLAALASLGYEEPTPIQREAIPVLLAGRDLLGQAATGTGKTAAFALPILQGIDGGGRERPSALVLVPTRELAMQVSEAVHRYGTQLGARVLPVYGGQPIGRQLRSLERGVDVVVATPGRALDHIGRGTLTLDAVRTVVLDEADEMLDMGFAEDIEAILEAAPRHRQTVLFSATLPARITRIAKRHLQDPARIEIKRENAQASERPLVRQRAYVVARAHKAAALCRILDVEVPGAAIVFCRTRDEVDSLAQTLNGRGYRAEPLHGGMAQEQRDRVVGRLRAGTAELLVATDVAARGLDIEQLTHVVNYDVPSAPEAYVHRTGRVGRAGREGTAITLVEPREHSMLKALERASGRRLPVETLPTVADLRARRLELTRAAIEEAIVENDLDGFRVVVEPLSDEYDLVRVALAAAKVVHEAGGITDDEEIPEAPVRQRDKATGKRSGESAPREPSARPGKTGKTDKAGKAAKPGKAGGATKPGRAGKASGASREATRAGTTRLYVGLGRSAGVRPQDLVGAITGESALSGRDIGSVEISDRFSLVEVPERSADDVVQSLRGVVIRGRKATVRRERY